MIRTVLTNLLLPVMAMLCLRLPAQPDSLPADTLYFTDTTRRIPTHLHFYEAGGGFTDGNFQYFDGYGHEIMYANSRSGLPLYSDWDIYSPATMRPAWAGGYIFAGWCDSVKRLRVRIGLTYSQRSDSMDYSGGFAVNDTVFGRDGTETTSYAGVIVSGWKTTRKIFNVLRFYGGAELEAGVALTSDIMLHEYSYDFGQQALVDENYFYTKGTTRFNFYGQAIVGLETIIAGRIGLFGQIRSGIGMHWVPNSGLFGLSRTSWAAGCSVFFFNDR